MFSCVSLELQNEWCLGEGGGNFFLSFFFSFLFGVDLLLFVFLGVYEFVDFIELLFCLLKFDY